MKPYQMLILASIITFPIALYSRAIFTPLVWIGAFLMSLAMTCGESSLFDPIFHGSYTAIFFALTFLGAGFSVIGRIFGGADSLTRAFRIWTIILCAVSLTVAESGQRAKGAAPPWISYLPGYFLFLVAALGMAFGAVYTRAQRISGLGTLVAFLGAFHVHLFAEKVVAAMTTVATVSTLACFAVFQATLRQRHLAQLCVVLIVLRLFAQYFDVPYLAIFAFEK